MRRGLLFIVSAPSGTGKTTVVERLVTEGHRYGPVALVYVASATTQRDRWGRL